MELGFKAGDVAIYVGPEFPEFDSYPRKGDVVQVHTVAPYGTIPYLYQYRGTYHSCREEDLVSFYKSPDRIVMIDI